MKKLLFIFAIGLIPIWIILIITLIQGISVATPWYIVIALPCLLASFGTAILTSTIYEKEDKGEKLKTATFAFISCCILVFMIPIGNFLLGSNKNAQHEKKLLTIEYIGENHQLEKDEIKDINLNNIIEKEWFSLYRFAKNNPEIIKQAKKIREIYPASRFAENVNSLPTRYMLLVIGKDKSIYPVIDVKRNDSETTFTLACFVPRSYKESLTFKRTCENISTNPTNHSIGPANNAGQ